MYVDDEVNLLDVTRLFLKKIDANIDLDTAASAKDALEMIAEKKTYDAIISDYEMPEIDGIEFLKIIRKKYPFLPFIIFTGRGREEVVMEALNLGADFYIQKGSDVKSQFAELVHKLRIAVTKNKYKNALNEYNERLSLILDSTNIGLLDYDCMKGNAFFSPNYCMMLGYDPDEFHCNYESWKDLIHPDDRDDTISKIIENINGNTGTYEKEFRLKTNNGDYKWISGRGKVVERDQDGKPLRIVGVHTDISNIRDAKENLRMMGNDIKTTIKGEVSVDKRDDGFNSHLLSGASANVPGEVTVDAISNHLGENAEVNINPPVQGRQRAFTMLPKGDSSVFYAMGLSNVVTDDDEKPICNMVSFYYIDEIKKKDESN